MNGRRRPARAGRASIVWRAAVAVTVAIALYTAGCGRDIPLGVDPGSDAAASDGGGADAGADGAAD